VLNFLAVVASMLAVYQISKEIDSETGAIKEPVAEFTSGLLRCGISY
jgi:hypothetical protein